jgi:ADP-ribose pyrophosphatase
VDPDVAFRVTGTDILFESSFIQLHELTVATPSGPVARFAVRHPGVVTMIPVHDGRVYLIRQYRAAVDQSLLELPAGTLEKAEPPDDAAVRELREEIGFQPGRLEKVFGFYTAPGFTDEYMTMYLATQLTAVPASPDGPEEEAAEVEAIALEEIPGLLVSGTLADAKTIIGLQWLARYGAE